MFFLLFFKSTLNIWAIKIVNYIKSRLIAYVLEFSFSKPCYFDDKTWTFGHTTAVHILPWSTSQISMHSYLRANWMTIPLDSSINKMNIKSFFYKFASPWYNWSQLMKYMLAAVLTRDKMHWHEYVPRIQAFLEV